MYKNRNNYPYRYGHEQDSVEVYDTMATLGIWDCGTCLGPLNNGLGTTSLSSVSPRTL